MARVRSMYIGSQTGVRGPPGVLEGVPGGPQLNGGLRASKCQFGGPRHEIV